MLEQELNTWVLIHGSAKVELKSGIMNVFGYTLKAPTSLEVPIGRVIPAFVKGKIVVISGYIEIITKDPFPKKWLLAIDEIKRMASKRKPIIVIVIGGIDVGKSSWILYATNILVQSQMKVGIIDGDIGQAKVGPPATIKSAICKKPTLFLEDLKTKELVFIGGKTPAGRLLQISCGITHLVNKLKNDVDVILIDTTGFVFSGPARALKLSKISLINPDLIIFIEVGRELEHLRQILKNRYKILRLPRPETMRPVAREYRIQLRKEAYKRFWHRSIRKKLILKLSDIFIENAYLGSGISINHEAINENTVYAEIGPDYFLCITRSYITNELRRKIYRKMKELWKKLSLYALAAPYAKTPPLAEIKALCGEKLQEIIEMIRRSPPRIEIQVVSEDIYKNLLVGIVGQSGEDIGIGILEKIDWVNKTIEINSALLRDEKVIGIKLGWIKLDSSFSEMGERPIGLG